jgi:hypothetical protein
MTGGNAVIVCGQSAVPFTLAALLISAEASIGSAWAQDTIIQSQTAFYVQTSAGAPTVCGIEFSMMFTDRTYRHGAIAGLKGSVGWFESEGQVGVILKLGGFDFPNGSPQIFRIPNAFLSVRNKPIPLNNNFPCDGQPMGFCGTYWMSAPADLYQAAIANTHTISFQREQNGLDVSLSIDIQSAAMTKPEEYSNFSTCMVALAGRAKRNLKR